MLVVLVLTAMLAGILIQSLGFFLGKYDVVRRLQSRSLEQSVQQRWFVTSVQNILPIDVPNRRFEGDSAQFRGTTLAPLAAESGTPSLISWAISQGENGAPEVRYSEGAATHWLIAVSRADALFFEYADASGTWHDRWPITGNRAGQIPAMIRMVRETGIAQWSAATILHPYPVPNFLEGS
jgi:hypothetical protein